MTEREQLVRVCRQLGADGKQASAMADQLIKRADQLVQRRGLSRVQAMAHLLELVTKGARGEPPAGFEGSGRPVVAEVKPVDPSAGGGRVRPFAMQQELIAAFRRVHQREPEIVARAPGRIEFIGNHTDYNGGTVLGAAVDRSVWVAVARRPDHRRRFFSELGGEVIEQVGPPHRLDGRRAWANYPLGILAALPEFELKAPEGFDYVAASDLPSGAGLSSSAAIELASGLAFLALTGQRVPREVLVKIGRHAENHFVGVPCGILDQGVSGFGRRDHLVFIDCRGPRFSTVPLPAEARFWIFNTHTKHALVDGLYAARNQECREVARQLGVEFLADARLSQLEEAKARVSSEGFKRARHVIEEIARVDATCEALRRGRLDEAGAALTASHRSSQHLFENSTPELDFLVDQLVGIPGVFGARLTGGGFGGAVMALTGASFESGRAQEVAANYAVRFGAAPEVLPMQTGAGAELVVADEGASY